MLESAVQCNDDFFRRFWLLVLGVRSLGVQMTYDGFLVDLPSAANARVALVYAVQ